MICPNCSTLCGETDRFCYQCGTPLTTDIRPAPKKGSHWIPIVIMAVLCVIGLCLFFVTAGTDTPKAVQEGSEYPWFRVEEGYLFFDETLYTGGSEITVPSQIDGQTVRGLGEGCFQDCTSLTTVILPDTLAEINSYAFSGCTAMRGIYLPESVLSLGTNAFYGCTALEAISIPRSVRWIGPDTFDECNKLWYIFYQGSHGNWVELYDEFINLYTGVICEDGSFYQGGDPY